MGYEPKTVTIYSVGLLGGSIGIGLKRSGFEGKIIGLSSDKGLKTAREAGLIDEGHPYSELSEVIKRTDLLILCSPILAIVNTIKLLGNMELPAGLVITDVGSTKKLIVDTAEKYLPGHVRFIGGHPMAGSEKSGPAASDPNLYQNAVYVLTPARGGSVPTTDTFAEFLQKYLKCRTTIMDPAKHDRAAAAVSHVPHILASALVLLASDRDTAESGGVLPLAAGGFRDMTRIASAHYDIWHDIFSTNKEAILPQIDSYIEILKGMRHALETDTLKEQFEEAHKIRDRI